MHVRIVHGDAEYGPDETLVIITHNFGQIKLTMPEVVELSDRLVSELKQATRRERRKELARISREQKPTDARSG